MSKSRQVLCELLKDQSPSTSLSELTPIEMAQLYTDTAFLLATLNLLKEQYWLQSKVMKPNYELFLAPFLKLELAPLSFMHELLVTLGPNSFKEMTKAATKLEVRLLEVALASNQQDQKIFITEALTLMSVLFIFESKLQQQKKELGLSMGLCLYRSFDGLDQILKLNYEADQAMALQPLSQERLYERTGVGVQSGFSTILLAIDKLQMKPGCLVIDLGSGYGRVGLAIGLMRPDVKFSGFEYVSHRVDIANHAAQNFAINDQVNFYTQDLSLQSFKLPAADVYYLYDPFCEETYCHVLQQILTISRNQKVTIVTKGNARGPLVAMALEQGWPAAVELDGGNLCFFTGVY